MSKELEERLVKEFWINPNQFITAKEEEKKRGKSLYSTLIKLGYLTEEDIYLFFAQNARIPFIRISDYEIDPETLKLFPEALYREHLFLPLFKVDDLLYVCMANPLDYDFIENLKLKSGCDICHLFSHPASISRAINRFFGPDDKYFDLGDLIVSPQTLNKVPFWRESERVSINFPVEFKVDDKRVKLASGAPIAATATDISSSGKAMAIKTFIFIPPGIEILVKFPSPEINAEAKAEVARCNMEKGAHYFLGVKFLAINERIVKAILGT